MDILLFGDQSADCRLNLERIVTRNDRVVLTALLEKVNISLREEITRQPSWVRDCVPCFSNIADLVTSYYESDSPTAILEGTLLCLCQLAEYAW